MTFSCIPVHVGCSGKTKVVEPAEGRGTIFILHVLYQVVGTSIGLTLVLPWVGQNDLARGVVLVKGKEGLFLVVLVGHNNGAKGVVFENLDVWVAHIFKFSQAQHLLCNCMAYDVLLHGGKAVRE